jgi:hypothetical protein
MGNLHESSGCNEVHASLPAYGRETFTGADERFRGADENASACWLGVIARR